MAVFMFMIIAIALFAILSITTPFLRRRTHDLFLHEKFANTFHKSALPLVSDDETPEEVLEILSFMNKQMSNPNAARRFYGYIVEGNVDVLSVEDPPEAAVVKQFLERRPELGKLFVSAAASSMLAMTFLSPVYGKKVRFWLTAIDSKDSREKIVIAYQNANKNFVGNVDDCLAAA